ncbi:MAG: D-alanyl-D-alanine carboxypeptidase/D-alanyl-D-alanine-endopeptidase [Pseudomonadota bacterium]
MRFVIFALTVVLAAPVVASDALPARVQSALDARNLPADSLSIHVTDLATGDPVLDWNGDVARNPASTMKLVTTLVALDVLGPSYRWKTDVYALGSVEDGQLEGDLLLKGYGDPFLVTERVWQMLRRVQQLGIREVGGDLLLDDSYFSVAPYDPGGFDRQPLRAYNVAPNALMMNFKVVRYWFEPDAERNRVRVQLDPPLDNLRVENRLSLANSSCRGYQRGISITPDDNYNAMIFEGRFPSGCERYAMDRSALEHDAFAYGLVSTLWEQLGGELKGGYRRALAPEEAEPILSFSSLSLTEAIARVNKYSNNVMARQLLYTLSAETLGAPGTEDGGREVIDTWLRENLPRVDSLSLDNGAGLSRDARLSAEHFTDLLAFAWRQPYMPEFAASLALSGHDGTLRDRFDDAQLTGRAHLKTGSLDHVSAIAGYLQSRSGRRFAVAVLQNAEDVHRGPGEEVQWAVLRWLNEQ